MNNKKFNCLLCLIVVVVVSVFENAKLAFFLHSERLGRTQRLEFCVPFSLLLLSFLVLLNEFCMFIE